MHHVQFGLVNGSVYIRNLISLVGFLDELHCKRLRALIVNTSINGAQ